MARDPAGRPYVSLGIILAIVAQLVIVLVAFVTPGGYSWLVWVLIACDAAAVASGVYLIRAFVLSSILGLVGRRWSKLDGGYGLLDRKELSSQEAEAAFPVGPPPGVAAGRLEEAGLSGRAADKAAWAEEVGRAHSSQPAQEGAPRPFVTTVGLVRMRDLKIKLAVINYFLPRNLLRAWRSPDETVQVADEEFPVVERLWMPAPVVSRGLGAFRPRRSWVVDGHCWVTFGQDPVRYGVVTSRHVIQPADSELGADVYIETNRSTITGKLRESSIIMDAALVEVDEADVPRLKSTPATEFIGYKPVRLVTGSDYQPAAGIVTGLPGIFHNGVYARQPGKEPIMPAYMTFDASSRDGDSGCLVLDIESEERGYTAPYMIYQGVINLGRGVEGYGLFLGQVVAQWSVNTHSNAVGEEGGTQVVPRES